MIGPHAELEGGIGTVEFRPDRTPLLAGLVVLLLALGVMFCGPLFMPRAPSASLFSVVGVVAIYSVLVALGVRYYRSHPRVRSYYLITEAGLYLRETVEDASGPPAVSGFLPWTDVAGVEVTPQGRIRIDVTGGETILTSWQVNHAGEFKRLARKYMG